MLTHSTPTISKFSLKSVMVLSFLLIICRPSLLAQDFRFIGRSQQEIEKAISESEKYYKKPKSMNKLNYSLKSEMDSAGNKIQYIEMNEIQYKTPYVNFTYKFFINEEGYCDSLIWYENACMDCATIENKENLRLFNSFWNKLSLNQYRSYQIYSHSNGITKKYKMEYSYVRMVRDNKPINGACRMYTFTLEEPLTSDVVKVLLKKDAKMKTIAYSKSLLILSLLTYLITLL